MEAPIKRIITAHMSQKAIDAMEVLKKANLTATERRAMVTLWSMASIVAAAGLGGVATHLSNH